MFAVYAAQPNLQNPLASLVIGERPEPVVPEGWVRVKVSHASLNRQDIFTLRGFTAQATPIRFPMILGNDGAATKRSTFDSGETLPRRVHAVVDNEGQATWLHTLQSVRRCATVITVGITSGNDPSADLLRLFVEQITVKGTILGTLEEMQALVRFLITAGIEPEIGQVLPMEQAEQAFRAMVEGRTHGKTGFTR